MLVQAHSELLVDMLAQKLRSIIENKNRTDRPCSIFLAGGSTPKPLYEKLPSIITDWSKVHLFLGDERYTPDNRKLQNSVLIKETLVNKINIPDENVFLPDLSCTANESASRYSATLEDYIKKYGGFDVILLGLGEDGHTLSLFPFGTAIDSESLYECVDVDLQVAPRRLTGTMSLLKNIHDKIFLVTGSNKQDVINLIFKSKGDAKYPSSIVNSQCSGVTWYVDQDIEVV